MFSQFVSGHVSLSPWIGDAPFASLSCRCRPGAIRDHSAPGIRPGRQPLGEIRKERVARNPHQRLNRNRQHRAFTPWAQRPEPHHVE